MDSTTRRLAMGAAGAVSPTYVEDVFSTWLYTGNGSTQTITNGIDLAGKGGLVWLKSRSAANTHGLFDTARGAGYRLTSTATNAQDYSDDYGYVSNYGSSGFTLASPTSGGPYNATGSSNASWTFRKAEKFFDVVTYTGNGSARSISHSLGSVPGCIIVKRTDSTGNWQVYHRAMLGASSYTRIMYLNTTAGLDIAYDSEWGSSAPTSSVFNVGASTATNANGATYVAYLFAHDAGGFGDSGNDSVISCGSYTGNGSTSGPTVTLGWEPQWLMIKSTSTIEDWYIYDSMRGITTGGPDPFLRADLSGAETTTSDHLSVTATGFQPTTTGTATNQNGGTYIYIAIRRGPMKTPTDATKVFSASLRTGTGSLTDVTTLGFPTDLFLTKARSQSWYSLDFYDRLRGSSRQLQPAYAVAETTPTAYPFAFLQNGYTLTADSNGYVNYSGESYIDLNLRRAPGFFDVVAYTGTGSNASISHGLGIVPELIIAKCRSNTGPWPIYHKDLGVGSTARYTLNTSTGPGFNQAAHFYQVPTSTVFYVGTDSDVNANGITYIAYLFASCNGVSKVGSYTGTGTTQQINCGFTSGARFVLIKRTDSTGDWYVWDSARGIVAGNDPYLLLNSIAAEVTNTDYVDTFSAGFEISSTAPAAINANGGTFIFLAVA